MLSLVLHEAESPLDCDLLRCPENRFVLLPLARPKMSIPLYQARSSSGLTAVHECAVECQQYWNQQTKIESSRLETSPISLLPF